MVPVSHGEEAFNFVWMGNAGIPDGFMDFSINSVWVVTGNVSFPIQPQLMAHHSFTTKKDSGSGGRLSILTQSGYLLGRFNLPTPVEKALPYIAAGGAIHHLISFASTKSAFGYDVKHLVSLKGHFILGMDITITPTLFLAAWARTTFPADILLDSGYFGLGLQL
jgi:hypothetical protein